MLNWLKIKCVHTRRLSIDENAAEKVNDISVQEEIERDSYLITILQDTID